MLDTKVIQVTGRGTNVNFVIDDSAPMETVNQGLREHLTEHRALYSRGTITVNVGRRILEREELVQIKQILEKESGVTVSRFWCAPDILEKALSDSVGFGVAVSPADAPHRDDADRSRSRESRKSPRGDEDQAAALEKWTAYVLEDTPPLKERPRRDPAEAAESPAPEGPASADVQPPEEAPREEQPAGPEAEPEVTQHGPGLDREPVPPVETGAAARPGKKAAEEVAPGPQEERATPIDSKQEMVGLYRGNEALLIKTTCRSGEVIRYPGDVVVLADVNPGAEIIADGDILVFGNLRGLAHAGAGGDIQATIIALNLDTHRLQIGPYTGVAPKSNKRSKSNTSRPRIALVRRRAIYVAPYAGRFAGYSGGTLYDG